MGIANITSSRAKLIRARVHREALDDEIRTFGKRKDAKAGDITYGRDGAWHIVYLSPIPALPYHAALIAGDCLNNTRSVLDHLISQLVFREEKEPCKRNCFPVYKTLKEFTEQCTKPATRNAKDFPLYGIPFKGDAWAIIQKAQPFNSPEPEKHGLVWLNYLTNIDKHNSVFVQRTYVASQVFSSLVSWSPGFQPVEGRFAELPLSPEQPTEIARYRFSPGVEPDLRTAMHMEGDLSVRPCIGYRKSQVPIGTLDITIRLVHDILEKIAALPRVEETALQSLLVDE